MDVSPGGTSVPQQQKFHTDDVKSVRNLVGALIGRHSSYIVLPIVTNDRQKTIDHKGQM